MQCCDVTAFCIISISEEHKQIYLLNVRTPLIYGNPYTVLLFCFQLLFLLSWLFLWEHIYFLTFDRFVMH